MRIDLLTKEYPPEIYGGAGVHVSELVRALRRTQDVRVRCFGAPRDEIDVSAYPIPPSLSEANAALQTLGVDLAMAADCGGADIVHSHTWYTAEAGRLAQQLYDIPHVLTAHSLEPLRPWKAEQLGGGYLVSSHVEREAYESADAIIAVSAGMRRDILLAYPQVDSERVHVIHNGIDCEAWRPTEDSEFLATRGFDTARPSVIFVGRITRQKGLPYLLAAVKQLPRDVQVILAAGAPDTIEIKNEVESAVADLSRERDGVIWIPEHLPRHELATLLTAATVFVCPSIYEPLGIVNLEAMACGTAVVGTATGGIPEVVADGETGWLVPIEQVADGTGTPTDPDRYIADLAAVLTDALSDVARATRFGIAARKRAQSHFDWNRIADDTASLYASVIAAR